MVATVVGLVIALVVFFSGTYIPRFSEEVFFPHFIFQNFFGLSLFLSLTPWFMTSLLSRKKKLCPVVQAGARACSHDRCMKFLSGGIFLIALLGLILSSQRFLPLPLAYALAIVYVGLIIDLLKMSFRRIQKRSSPLGIADWLVEKLKKAVRGGNERGVLESFELIFSLLVTYAKHGDVSSMRLFSLRVVGLMEEILRMVSVIPLFRLAKEDTLLDRYSIAEAMTAKRLAWAMKVAGQDGNPAALEEAMRLYGKLFMTFHNYHESLGYLLFLSLSQNLLKIEKLGELDKDAEFMMVCSELVKSLIDRSTERRVTEKNSVLRILKVLENYVRECFRRDKTISPAFLMQPFAEIGQLMAGERYATLPERDDILSELRRILAQFSALEMVSTRMEVAEPGTDTKASYKEDLPYQKH